MGNWDQEATRSEDKIVCYFGTLKKKFEDASEEKERKEKR